MRILYFFILWCTVSGLAGGLLGYLGYRANRDRSSAPTAPEDNSRQPAEHCGELLASFFGTSWVECVLRPGHQGSHASEEGARWFETPVTPVEEVHGRPDGSKP